MASMGLSSSPPGGTNYNKASPIPPPTSQSYLHNSISNNISSGSIDSNGGVGGSGASGRGHSYVSGSYSYNNNNTPSVVSSSSISSAATPSSSFSSAMSSSNNSTVSSLLSSARISAAASSSSTTMSLSDSKGHVNLVGLRNLGNTVSRCPLYFFCLSIHPFIFRSISSMPFTHALRTDPSISYRYLL